MNIKDDSRKINKGDIFVALKKEHDGHDYVLDAIKAGASEVVVEHGLYSVKTTVVNNTHEYLVNYLKENYYDLENRCSKMMMVSAELLQEIINEYSSIYSINR